MARQDEQVTTFEKDGHQSNEDDPAVLERDRRASLLAEHRAHLAAFPIGVRVHLAVDNGELLRERVLKNSGHRTHLRSSGADLASFIRQRVR